LILNHFCQNSKLVINLNNFCLKKSSRIRLDLANLAILVCLLVEKNLDDLYQ